MYKRTALFLLLILLSSSIPRPVFAQAGGPVYIVQAGDTLSYIASRFNVTLADLVAANPAIDPNVLNQGQQLVIPGLEGITGTLETEVIEFGDSLRSLSRRTQVSDSQLIRLNRLVSPTELYAGVSMILPVSDGQTQLNSRTSLGIGETLLEIAVRQGSDQWTLTSLNKLNGTWAALPNDVLYSPTGNDIGTNGLPFAFISASVEPLPMIQGSTEIVRVQLKDGFTASGTLVDNQLHFYHEDGGQVALQGVHALLEPGVYPLRLEATLPDGSLQSYEQMVLVKSGDYYSEELYVNPETIDPAITLAENNQIISITNVVTATKLWDDRFTAPSIYPDQYTSWYGTRRTYHGIGTDLVVEGFHTGLDFAGGEGLQISAPAAGRVVFAGPLTVRGNATIIDHGWGIFSGFWHQSQINVNVGDMVSQGQVIGLVGGTGRVTGAHLHWEVWANGIQVDPLDWLNKAYP